MKKVDEESEDVQVSRNRKEVKTIKLVARPEK
jgi:hypothetical protein